MCDILSVLLKVPNSTKPASDFHDQDMYHKTKLSMRAFAFGSFKAGNLYASLV